MTRRTKTILLVIFALAAALAVWILGGFLWPRPQFQRPDAPWSADTGTDPH